MTTESDLIFSPQANHNFSRILTDLKRANLSIGNRLRSIRADADFVSEVAAAFGRPVVANERCGSWYVDPRVGNDEKQKRRRRDENEDAEDKQAEEEEEEEEDCEKGKAASAYFKSTDGHTGQWNFSTRRLNLHLLPLIGRRDGCVIVDSTRRGKLMPDALSKTVPIWCCVLNHLLFPLPPSSSSSPGNDHNQQQGHVLYTPPGIISPSEHAQASSRIAHHVAALRALGIVDDVTALRKYVTKPLRPVWVTPESTLPMSFAGSGERVEIFEDAHPVICCTASRRVMGGEMSEGGYIQGAGDDTENWALGLTPLVFWKNVDRLLSTPETELSGVVRELVRIDAEGYALPDGGGSVGGDVIVLSSPVLVLVASCLFVARMPVVTAAQQREDEDEAMICTIAFVPRTTPREEWVKSSRHLEVGIGKQQKLASRNLRAALELVCDFADAFLGPGEKGGEGEEKRKRRIIIACETGKDLSVGVALALACRLFDDRGKYRGKMDVDGYAPVINKALIKTRLGRIMMAFPEANPSRTTLQSVNSYLMG